jgi:hypothetical protein
MFLNLGDLNGRMDSAFSGTYNDGTISPPITGTVYQPILELLAAKNLVLNSLLASANTYTLTSFREGDSVVNIADKTKVLGSLYSELNRELESMIKQVKFTIATNNPASVVGLDAAITEQISFRNYDVYRSNQT